LHLRSESTLDDLAEEINPRLRGWMQYYCRFRASEFKVIGDYIDRLLVRWAMRKYKRLRGHRRRAYRWLAATKRKRPDLFHYWSGRSAQTARAMGAR